MSVEAVLQTISQALRLMVSLTSHTGFGDHIVVNQIRCVQQALLGAVILAALVMGGCGGGQSKGAVSTPAAPLPVNHYVDLRWTPTTSAVSGYNIYRGTQAGGPYSRINSSLAFTSAYTDNAVRSGLIYYYVTTSVDSSNVESDRSNETVAAIPSP